MYSNFIGGLTKNDHTFYVFYLVGGITKSFYFPPLESLNHRMQIQNKLSFLYQTPNKTQNICNITTEYLRCQIYNGRL